MSDPDRRAISTRAPLALEAVWSGHFSADDRADSEALERALATGDAREAVLRCAALAGRLLRVDNLDQAVLALLLGIDGSDWIRFQTAARAAREGGELTRETATACFSFLLGAASRLSAAKP